MSRVRLAQTMCDTTLVYLGVPMSRVRLAQRMCIDTTCRRVQKLEVQSSKAMVIMKEKVAMCTFEDNTKVS